LLRTRLTASFALAVYLAAAMVLPIAHRRHHALHGADHVHGPLGTVYARDAADPAASTGGAGDSAAYHHAAFDADLAALELADVAHAGAATVDCALADYTLVACDAAVGDTAVGDTAVGDASAAAHAPGFGDALLAHAHRHAPEPRPYDPSHGRGALEHLGASLLAQAPFVLPPPARPLAQTTVSAIVRSFASAPRRTHAPRGPPLV
jgi:hypothetical protein